MNVVRHPSPGRPSFRRPSISAIVPSFITTLRPDIPGEKAPALEVAAQYLSVSVEELRLATIGGTLERFDADFERAARLVLDNNAELYRRLA